MVARAVALRSAVMLGLLTACEPADRVNSPESSHSPVTITITTVIIGSPARVLTVPEPVLVPMAPCELPAERP